MWSVIPDDAPEDGGAPAAFSGSRLSWRDLPRHVRDVVTAVSGAQVVAEVVATSGFSPGFAGQLELADGGRVFVKAVSPAQNPESPLLARREITASGALPQGVPAPRLLWHHDDGEWVVLAFEAVDGRSPELPWRPGDLRRVLGAVVALGAVRPLAGHGLPSLAAEAAGTFDGWRRFAALEPAARAALAERHGERGAWLAENLDRLVAWEEAAPAALDGDRLVHGDMRGDNVLLDGDTLWFVDWPHAAVGAPWFDLVSMLPSVAMQGGGSPAALLASSGLEVPPDRLRAAVSAVAGHLAWSSTRPAPPGLPNLRAFQRAQAARAVDWLRELA